MANLARLWFHNCAASGWFPAALNLFLPTAIEEQAPEATFKLKFHENKAPSRVPATRSLCSFGHLMPPKLAVPANLWS